MTERDSNTSPRTAPPLSEWPGERLGLPKTGHMSVGRAGRRIAALCIDWGLAYLIATGFFQQNSMATLAIFAITQILGELIIGGSVGHRILGLRLIPLEGGYIGLWRPVARTLLLCLFIPALVWDSDQRGFHDKVAGTVLVRFTRQG